MERKHPTKTIKTAAIVFLMLFGASTFAQNLPVICLPANQTTYNLKDDPTMKSIVDSLELQINSGTRGTANLNVSSTVLFTSQGSSAFNINSSGLVSNITAGGIVEYTINFDADITFTDSVEASSGVSIWVDPCGVKDNDTNDWSNPGGSFDVFSLTMSGTYRGTVVLATRLPNTVPEITGAACFDNEIALSVQPVFQNFDCEWTATPSLTPNANGQSSVIYDVSNSTNSEYEIVFKVTDNVCGNGASKSDTIVVRAKTQQPVIAPIAPCIAIGTTSIACAVDNPHSDYTYHWYFRTNNQETFAGIGSTANINIAHNSGSIFVKAVGLCGDTATSEYVQINRELSDLCKIWATDTACIFEGDEVRFSLNYALQEEIIWTNTGNWTTQTANNTATLIATVTTGGTVTARSTACPNTAIDLDIEVMSSSEKIGIDGESCMTVGIAQPYTATGLQGATDYNWTFLGNSCGSTAQIDFTLPANYHGNNGQDSLTVTAIKCGKEFSASIPIRVALTNETFAVNPSTTCILTGDVFTFNITPNIQENLTWTLPTGLTEISKSQNAITVKAVAHDDLNVSVLNELCASSSASASVIVRDSNIALAITPANACLTHTESFSFTATPIEGATYTWTAFDQTTQSTTNVFSGTVPAGTSDTIVKVVAKVCERNYQAATIVGYVPATPGTITASQTCINQNMPDTLTFSIAAVAGATSYNWSVVSGGTIVGNNTGTQITVVTTGVDVQVSVSAVGCGTSSAQTLTVNASGIGENYTVVPMPIDTDYYFVSLDACADYMTLPTGLSAVWFANNNTTSYEISISNIANTNGFGGYIEFNHSLNLDASGNPVHIDEVSVIVTSSTSQCKSKFSVTIP